MTIDHEVQAASVKLAPVAAVATPTVFGVSLPTWVLIATLIYTVLQIYVLVRDKVLKKGNKNEQGSIDGGAEPPARSGS